MNISGSEALSNIASTFVGQVEAQIMIKPYLKGMTNSELTASMAGSYACIAGGVMATYIQFGVKAEYLLAASIMAAPGALAIAKIMFPETQESETKGEVTLKVKKEHSSHMYAAVNQFMVSAGVCRLPTAVRYWQAAGQRGVTALLFLMSMVQKNRRDNYPAFAGKNLYKPSYYGGLF